MRVLLQRVRSASVAVEAERIGSIDKGLLVFLGVDEGDTTETMRQLMDKCLSYRVFSDPQGKMNLSLRDIQGELLLVSQFTLCANTKKGLRPSFSHAASPALASELYEGAAEFVRQDLGCVQTGRFAADMQVSLVNDGPVTFLLEG